MAEAGGGGEDAAGAERRLYSSVAISGLNKSVRDRKNILEVTLEKSNSEVKFKLEDGDIVKLMTSLRIDRSECLGVQACPLGKNVVFFTLKKEINIIQRFARWRGESINVKPGITTARIGQKGKREVAVQIIGLDPETKDDVVAKYLAAHGDVNKTERPYYHLFKGGYLDGIPTGTRSYMVEVKKEMGSFHIIDGTKVEVRFEGQIKTCGNCYMNANECAADAISKNCQSIRVPLSEAMKKHWQNIGFEPDKSSVAYEENDDETNEIPVAVGAEKDKQFPALADLDGDYEAIKVVGVDKDGNLNDLLQVLHDCGLPRDKKIDDLVRTDSFRGKVAVHIANIEKEICKEVRGKVAARNKISKEKINLKLITATPPTPEKAREVPVEASEHSDDDENDHESVEEDNRGDKRASSESPNSLNKKEKAASKKQKKNQAKLDKKEESLVYSNRPSRSKPASAVSGEGP